MRIAIGTVVGAVMTAFGIGLGGAPASAVAYEALNGLIAYVAEVNGKAQIFSANPDGTGARRLTYGGASGSPAWSPGSEKIAFVSNRSGSQEVWVMNADGSSAHQLTVETDGQADSTDPSWSPDGSQIVYTRWGSAGLDIWIMNADGSGKHPVANNADAESYASWSPLGTEIVYARNAITVVPGGFGEPPTLVRNWELYKVNSDGSGGSRLTENTSADLYPEWRPDGETFLFTSHTSGSADVVEYDGGVFQVLVSSGNHEHAATPAPVGDGFAYVVNGSTVDVQDEHGARTILPGGSSPDWGTARPRCKGQAATQWGSGGSETLTGTSGNDVLVGLDGNDTVVGADGSDIVCGGTGEDVVKGGRGKDTAQGGPGNDVLSGGLGVDLLYGQGDDDQLKAKDGVRDSVIDGGGGTDAAVRDSIDPHPISVP